jgi:hypothetical protein
MMDRSWRVRHCLKASPVMFLKQSSEKSVRSPAQEQFDLRIGETHAVEDDTGPDTEGVG